jgi:hypothetical protein
VGEVLKAAIASDGQATIDPENWVDEDAWDTFKSVLVAEELPLPRYSQIGTLIKAYVTGSSIVATDASGFAPARKQELIGAPVVRETPKAKPAKTPTAQKPKPARSTVRKADRTEKAIAYWSDWLTSRGMDARMARSIHEKLEKHYA